MARADGSGDFAIARVVAAVDAVGQVAEVAAAAADIAARCKVEMLALFIEDDSLLRLASMPAARLLSLTPVSGRHPDPADLAGQMRARAVQAAAVFAGAAKARGIDWSFRVVKGMPEAKLREAIRPGDFVVLPSSVTIDGLPLRPFSALVQAAQVATSAALMVRGASTPSRPLVVAEADAGLIRLAISAWHRLHAPSAMPVDLVIRGPVGDVVAHALSDIHAEVRLRVAEDPTPGGVIRLARSLASDLLVIAGGASTGADYVGQLVAEADSQILLLR